MDAYNTYDLVPLEPCFVAIDLAFDVRKPPRTGLNPNHCEDCREMDAHISTLHPRTLALDDIVENWRFEGCGLAYRRYLFPGMVRLCFCQAPYDIDLLFFWIESDFLASLNLAQAVAIAKLYESLDETGLVVGDERMRRELEIRLSEIRRRLESLREAC